MAMLKIKRTGSSRHFTYCESAEHILLGELGEPISHCSRPQWRWTALDQLLWWILLPCWAISFCSYFVREWKNEPLKARKTTLEMMHIADVVLIQPCLISLLKQNQGYTHNESLSHHWLQRYKSFRDEESDLVRDWSTTWCNPIYCNALSPTHQPAVHPLLYVFV